MRSAGRMVIVVGNSRRRRQSKNKSPGHPRLPLGLESGEGLQPLVDLREARNAVGRQVQRLDTPAEMIVRVTLPAGLNARVELSPRLLVFIRILLVGLVNVQLPARAGFLHKWGVTSSQPSSGHG